MSSETLRRAASNDPHAEPISDQAADELIGKLMQQYGDELYRLCLSITKAPDAAADALQQVFIKAHAALGGFEGRASYRTWLFSIARNQCLDDVKAARRREAVHEQRADYDAATKDDSSVDTHRDQLKQILDRCLGKLDPAIRTAVVLRFAHECSFVEIESITGEHRKKVQAQVRRALPALRGCVESSGATL